MVLVAMVVRDKRGIPVESIVIEVNFDKIPYENYVHLYTYHGSVPLSINSTNVPEQNILDLIQMYFSKYMGVMW